MWLYLDDKRLPTIKFKKDFSKREKLITFTNTKSFVDCLICNNNRITGVSLDYNLNYDFQGIDNFFIYDCNKYLYTGEDVLEYVLISKFKNYYLSNLKIIRIHSKNPEIASNMYSLICKYITYTDSISVILDPCINSGYDYIPHYCLY